MTSANKVRSVARNLEQLIEELPIFLLRLEEVTAALDDKLEWREFKFCFKVGTSKVVSSFSVSFTINWNLPHFEIFKLL
jgi:hypothetical protein